MEYLNGTDTTPTDVKRPVVKATDLEFIIFRLNTAPSLLVSPWIYKESDRNQPIDDSRARSR